VKECNFEALDSVQSAIVTGRFDSLELQGIGGHRSIEKANPKYVINFEDKRVLNRLEQTVSTKG
jgi:hypothetical protein